MSWNIIDNKLVKELVFETQTELAEVVFGIATQADAMGHHPDILVTKAFCMRLELFTHSVGAVTALDHELAKKIDEILE